MDYRGNMMKTLKTATLVFDSKIKMIVATKLNILSSENEYTCTFAAIHLAIQGRRQNEASVFNNFIVSNFFDVVRLTPHVLHSSLAVILSETLHKILINFLN